jgi:hypothetical protein
VASPESGVGLEQARWKRNTDRLFKQYESTS